VRLHLSNKPQQQQQQQSLDQSSRVIIMMRVVLAAVGLAAVQLAAVSGTRRQLRLQQQQWLSKLNPWGLIPLRQLRSRSSR
jgi:hypothetical protein